MHAARSNLHTPRSASGLGATVGAAVRAGIGLTLAPSAAHADIEVVPVMTVPASEITHRLILSGDGQVMFRSASPTLYAPSVVRRWTQASGHVVVPPPEGRTAWVARSTSMFGEWTAGEAPMGMTSHACMHHTPSGSSVPIFHDDRSAAIGVTPLQVHASENQTCWYRLPGDGFFSVGSIPVGQISAVHDVAGARVAGVGAGVSIDKAGSRTLPWVSVANGSMAGCFDPADLNHDGVIDAADLAMVLAAWGLGGPTDLTGDGTTDASDLAMVLAAWS